MQVEMMDTPYLLTASCMNNLLGGIITWNHQMFPRNVFIYLKLLALHSFDSKTK